MFSSRLFSKPAARSCSWRSCRTFLAAARGIRPGTTKEPIPVGLEAFIRQRLVPEMSDLYAETHRQVDRLLLPCVLEYTGGNQHQASRLLGIARQTLRQKLRDLGLHVTHSVEAGEAGESVSFWWDRRPAGLILGVHSSIMGWDRRPAGLILGPRPAGRQSTHDRLGTESPIRHRKRGEKSQQSHGDWLLNTRELVVPADVMLNARRSGPCGETGLQGD